jgi:hypothetical protein
MRGKFEKIYHREHGEHGDRETVISTEDSGENLIGAPQARQKNASQ